MMRGALILAGLMATSATVWADEPKSEQLDAAFLEYLANLEGDDDNWTVLAEAAEEPADKADDQARSETSKPRRQSKEPAKPAAEDR